MGLDADSGPKLLLDWQEETDSCAGFALESFRS